jgi:hypothetical protein
MLDNKRLINATIDNEKGFLKVKSKIRINNKEIIKIISGKMLIIF